MPYPLVSHDRPALPGGLLLLALLSMSVSPGCTSALTTAYLRGTPWNLSDPAGDEGEADETAGSVTKASSAEAAAETLSPEDRTEARQAAIERAMQSLAAVGTVDAATEAALVTLLQGTDQEDWPTVVDEFVAALAATPHVAAKPSPVAVAVPTRTMTVAPPADPLPPAEEAPTAPEPPDFSAVGDPAVGDSSVGDSANGDPAVDDPAVHADLVAGGHAAVSGESADAAMAAADPSGPEIAIHNACFATRVQAWGVVDRFAADRFRPGQEIIVYFELENLAVDRTPAGHTTCIDSDLVLVAADGRRIHDWSFEPIQETCPARRRDYFARYVVRIPGTVSPGACRLEIAVTDTLAGRTATTTLPLEIVAN